MGKETTIQSSLYRYLLGGISGILLLYTVMQYMVFKSAYDQNFLKEASQVEHLFQNILEDYKITLKKISNEVTEKDLFSDKKGIEDTLKRAYAYGIDSKNREKVRTSGINWIGVGGTKLTPIGRLGEVKHTLKFTPEYLGKLEKSWGELEVSNVSQVENPSEVPLVNIGIGTGDKNDTYRGFVNVRIDLNSLKEMLSSKPESGLQFILLNEKGYEVLSSLPEGLSINESLGIGEHVKEIFKGNFPTQQYIFPLQSPVNGFPYVLSFGYDQNQFYLLFLKQNYLSFLLLCSSLFLVAFFSKRFIKKSLRFYKEKNREKNLTINRLMEENHRLTGREKEFESSIKSSEHADRQEKKFFLEINERISQSLSTMLNIANFLLNRIQEENKIEENSKELMEIFERTYTHSRFFTLKNEEELVSINDVLDEVLVILSKQILKKELHIKYQKEKVIAILTDKTALKQALINIIGRAIKNSPRKGEISLTLVSQKENVYLECRDKGYLGEQQSTSEEKVLSLDCMSLEKSDMEKLVKSLGGTLSTLYKPYKGNTFVLQLPHQVKQIKSHLSAESDNIVSFSSLKKRREH